MAKRYQAPGVEPPGGPALRPIGGRACLKSPDAIFSSTFPRSVPLLMLRSGMGTEGLREQKKREARDALERAALQLFGERGFDEATIRDVAAAAGMSPRTFFRYFRSKEDVVFFRQAQFFHVLKDILNKELRKQEGSFEAMKAATFAFADFFQNRPPDEIKLRAKLLADSLALRRRAAHEIQAWGDELAHDLAISEGVEVQPRHFLITGVSLQLMQVAGATWGRPDSRLTYTDILERLFSELETMIMELHESGASL
jgi:AcrR family transcriptional regulator